MHLRNCRWHHIADSLLRIGASSSFYLIGPAPSLVIGFPPLSSRPSYYLLLDLIRTGQVGGPATCCANCWMTDFVKYMDSHSVPYDFISTHAYSSCQMAGLGDVGKVVHAIESARAELDNVTSTNHPDHPEGKTPKWLITEFGASCNQGFGDPDAAQFPSAIHDMIDQSSYTIATVAAIAGKGEPNALSYWAGAFPLPRSLEVANTLVPASYCGLFIRQYTIGQCQVY